MRSTELFNKCMVAVVLSLSLSLTAHAGTVTTGGSTSMEKVIVILLDVYHAITMTMFRYL